MNKRAWTKILEQSDKKDLVGLIINMADTNDAAETILIEYCKKKANPHQKELLYERQLQMKWDSIQPIVDEANEYGGCSREDENQVYDTLYEMQEIVKEHATAWDTRKDIADEMLEQANYGNSGFDDILFETALEFCRKKPEKKYLAEFLTKFGGSYWQDVGASLYEEIGENEQYLRFRMEHLVSEADYMDLAMHYEDRNEHEAAVKTAEKAVEKNAAGEKIFSFLLDEYTKTGKHDAIWQLYHTLESMDSKYGLGSITESMYEYCRQRKDYDGQRQMLIKMVSYGNASDAKKWYERCRKELKEKDFLDAEEKMIQVIKSRNITGYLDICMEKNQTKEVLDYVLKKKTPGGWFCIDADYKYSSQLEGQYPREILEYYWQEAERYTNAGKRENYMRAARLLGKIHTLMSENGWIGDWDTRYAEYKDRHKRKRLLFEAIDASPLS